MTTTRTTPANQPHPRRWQALIVLSISLLVVSVGNTILNVALPTIREELDASSSELQWIVDGYLLLFAGLLLAAGSLGDRFGRRRALVAGLVTFGLGSVLATLSTSSTELIASRALMGVGAAGIMPTTLSIITNIFPDDERPKAIAVWAAVAGLGVAVGPISGGWLIEHVDWSAIFLVNLPAVVVCLVGAALLVPESRDPDSPRAVLAHHEPPARATGAGVRRRHGARGHRPRDAGRSRGDPRQGRPVRALLETIRAVGVGTGVLPAIPPRLRSRAAARLAAIVAMLGGPAEPLPGGPLRAAA